jgi:SAM-dependent methyltransferase
MDREWLRATFNETAELYDRARPDYPGELIDDLMTLAEIGPRSRVLEIGAGTGKATVPVAERGCAIVAVELGADMAAVARRKLARFPSVTVVVSPFEGWPLPPQAFDAVLSATAWHWIDPAVRGVKAATALRPGGALALIGTHHIAGGDRDFFVEVQECYERWDPATEEGLRLPEADKIATSCEELNCSGRFGPVVLRRYEQDITYSTSDYLDVLLTYSGHRALDAERRDALLGCIARLIDTRYSGRVTKRYLFQLEVAHRRTG